MKITNNKLKHVHIGKLNNLYMHKSKKFKSIGISIVFKMKYDFKNITAFIVLSKYLGNCNALYPSIEKFNKYIESLYGCNVGIKTNYLGSLFTANFFVNIVNPKYVNDDTLIENTIKLLYDLIYLPLVDKNGDFDEDIFEICKQNCMIDVDSLKEYNMGYVLRTLKKTLSNLETSSMSASYLGDEKVLNSLNKHNLVNYYKKMIKSPFDIYVTGDYSFMNMEKLIRKYFKDKKAKSIDYSVFNLIENKTYEPIIINKKVSQCKLAIAYRIPILFENENHYAFRVARMVLSGTLASKFGKVIREQMGLCYSISSTYSSYYGTFIVTTGINKENIEKVVKEVNNQIEEVKIGNVSDEEFNQAKQALLSDIKSIDDSLFGTLNMIKTYHSFNKEFDLNEEIKKYENVSKNDVIEVCKLLTYCSYVALI